MKELKLSVNGMHCAACSSRIEKVVGGMEGVEKASVNLATETMELHWDDSAHSPSALNRIFLKRIVLRQPHV